MEIDEQWDVSAEFNRIKSEFKKGTSYRFLLDSLNQDGKKFFLSCMGEVGDCFLDEVPYVIFYESEYFRGPDSIKLFNGSTRKIIKHIQTEYSLSFKGIKDGKFSFVKYIDTYDGEYYDEIEDRYYEDPENFEEEIHDNLESSLGDDEEIDIDILEMIRFELQV